MHLAASNMKVSISRLIQDPEFYIFNYAESSQTSEFLIVSQELLERAPFIDNRLERFARGQFAVATTQLSELVDHQPRPRARQHFIFHHAFVCSTLLARCLAQSDAFFSLKEPHIVRRLADLQRCAAGEPGKWNPQDWARLLNTHLQLLAKNYTRGDKVVIKASNLANNLLPEILHHTRFGNCLYLYSSLPQFLVSNLKKPPTTRQKIPDLLRLFGQDSDFFQRYPEFRYVSRLSFLQQCALLWLLCNYNALAGMPETAAETGHARKYAPELSPEHVAAGRRVRTLAMEKFLESPRAVLHRVCRFFEHEPDARELDVMSGDILQSHAKDPNQAYNREIRNLEYQRITQLHGDEITAVSDWVQPTLSSTDIEARLQKMAL